MATGLTPDSVVTRNADHPSTELEREVIVLHVGSGAYFGLNEVGSDVWRWMETPIAFRDLCARIEAQYDVEPRVAEADLMELLIKLDAQGLIRVDV